jgi:hypothetical protein
MTGREASKLSGLKTVFGGVDCADDPQLCFALGIIENYKVGDADELATELYKASQAGDILAAFHLGEKVDRLCSCITYRLHFEKPCKERNSRNSKLAASREAKASKVKESRRDICDKVQKRMKAHPRDSLTYARQVVANDMGISLDSVKRATAGIKKPAKKRK